LVDEGEDIARFELDFDEAMRQAEAGEIVDAKTLLLLRWAEHHVFGPAPRPGDGPRLVFIAGPYRSGTDDREEAIAANVRAMQEAAVRVAECGNVPVLGEWVTLPLIEAAGGRRGDAVWDRYFHPHAQAVLERCDLLLRIGGASAGADAMVKAALARGLPVYYGLASLTARPA
jgi:ADP-ribose pyrophosphatase